MIRQGMKDIKDIKKFKLLKKKQINDFFSRIFFKHVITDL